jgi:hypothetical protein
VASTTKNIPVGPALKEEKEAGLWKTEHLPSDEEVEGLSEETRMKKYG